MARLLQVGLALYFLSFLLGKGWHVLFYFFGLAKAPQRHFKDVAIRTLYGTISTYWPVKRKTVYLGGDEEEEVDEPAGDEDSIDDPVDPDDGGDAEMDLALSLGVALAAPVVHPCPDSQVPPDTQHYSPVYSPSPLKDMHDDQMMDEGVAPIEPKELFAEPAETELDTQPVESEPVDSLPESPEITPTEIETTPKVPVVEIEDSPAKVPTPVAVSKDPMPSLKSYTPEDLSVLQARIAQLKPL